MPCTSSEPCDESSLSSRHIHHRDSTNTRIFTIASPRSVTSLPKTKNRRSLRFSKSIGHLQHPAGKQIKNCHMKYCTTVDCSSVKMREGIIIVHRLVLSGSVWISKLQGRRCLASQESVWLLDECQGAISQPLALAFKPEHTYTHTQQNSLHEKTVLFGPRPSTPNKGDKRP